MCEMMRRRSFATLAECFAEQQRRFVSDALLRKGILAGRSLSNVVVMVPEIVGKTLSTKLGGKANIVSLITSYFDKFLIKDFIVELQQCAIKKPTYLHTPSSIAVHPTADVHPVTSMALFQCFFYLYAGPVAKLQLPADCYFTGSLCSAAASYPSNLPGNGFNDDLTLIRELWDGFSHMGDYDGFVLAMNDFYAQSLSCSKLGPVQEQSWLREEDGEGPLARSDVDIVVTAQSDNEARAKIQTIVQRVLALVGDAAVIATPNGFTICPHFPQKHVQVIFLWTRSLLDYLLFEQCLTWSIEGRL